MGRDVPEGDGGADGLERAELTVEQPVSDIDVRRQPRIRRWIGWFDSDRMVLLAIAVAIAVFIGIRLGASLIGSRVFMGLDVLRLFEPWDYNDNHPVTSFWYVTDQLDSMIPSLQEVHQRFLNGGWPSWTNRVTGGQPLLSVPSLGVLTPGRWLYLFLPTWLAPAWSKLVELIVCWAGTYLFARRLNASKVSAALAGVIYPLTGFMIGWTNYPQVAVAAMIPALFWSVERYIQRPSARALAPVAIVVAFLMFGGFPAVAGQSLYAAGGYAVVRVVAANWRRARDITFRLLWLAGAACIGVGITAFQLLPFAHGVLGGVDLGYRSTDFFNHTKYVVVLSALFPRTFGTNNLCCSYSPQDINTYVGAVVMFLALLGVVQALMGRMQRSAGLYMVAIVVVVLVLIWFPGWWSNWGDHLPILHGNPIGRIRSQLGLPIAILAAAGLDVLRGWRWSPGWWAKVLPESRRLATGAAVLMCVVVAASAWRLHTHGYPFIPPAFRTDVLIAAVPIAIVAVLAPFRRTRTVLLVAVVAGVIVQGLSATSYYWPTAPRAEFYPNDPAIEFLQSHQGGDRIATTGYTMRANITAYYGLRTLNGHGFLDPNLKAVALGIDPTSLLGATYLGFTSNVSRILGSPGLARMGVHDLVASVDDVVPGTHTPVPIPGTVDPLGPASGTVPLVPGRKYVVQIPSGSLRGVNLPLTTSSTARLSVTVRDAGGAVVAADARRMVAGASTIPVPLAADSGSPTAAARPQPLTVELSVDGPGATATTDSSGRIRVQAVRPPAVGDPYRLAYAGSGLVIWELLDYLPRIHWAGSAAVITDPAARLKAVTSGPLKAGQVILSTAAAPGVPVTGGPTGQVKVTKDDGDVIAAHVTATAAGYLVVSDTIQSNFTATVDGRAAPIVPADVAGGAVYVPAGTHTVQISYTPAGATDGAAISLGSAVVLILVLLPPTWFAWFRRRRRRSGG